MPEKRKDPKRGKPATPRGEGDVEKPTEEEKTEQEAAPERQPDEPKGFPPPPGSTKGYDNPAQGLV